MSCPLTPGIHGRVSDFLRMKTLVSRASCIFNSSELSDVKFMFKNVSGSGHSQGQDEETIIYGHKLILALVSPVFHKMFYMDIQNQQFVTTVLDEVHMEDSSFNAEAFLEFMRFVYTDKIDYENLNFDMIVGILSCADYYDVPCLKEDCADQLREMITEENVFRLLEIAEMFRERDLEVDIFGFIDENLHSVIDSEEILCIRLETLFKILKRDSLDIDESFVLDLALKWAGMECERKNREPTGENKREVLGKVFFEIRFALLTSDRISELVSSNLLTRDESLDIVLEFHSPGYVTTAGKSKSKRRRQAPAVAFKSNPRIFGQKKKLMEEQEMQEKWREMYLRGTKSVVNLFIGGFPCSKTEVELKNMIQRTKGFCIFNLKVNKSDLDPGAFHVQFKYMSVEYRLTDLMDPVWYEFDNPRSIRITEWSDDESD